MRRGWVTFIVGVILLVGVVCHAAGMENGLILASLILIATGFFMLATD